MPFYRRKITFEDLAPAYQQYQEFMRQNTKIVHAPTESDPTEVFYATRADWEKWYEKDIFRLINGLRIAGYVDTMPMGPDGLYLFSTKNAHQSFPTITPTHIRLPKLSYLITLTPEDFFLLLRLVATAKNTQSGDSLQLNPGACGIHDLSISAVAPYFTKLRVNYRMNIEYCDRKWTPRDVIKQLANLDPTRDNQFSAMQYLTVLQNDDILYFPLESMIDLELDWEQVDDDYCIPPEGLTDHMVKV